MILFVGHVLLSYDCKLQNYVQTLSLEITIVAFVVLHCCRVTIEPAVTCDPLSLGPPRFSLDWTKGQARRPPPPAGPRPRCGGPGLIIIIIIIIIITTTNKHSCIAIISSSILIIMTMLNQFIIIINAAGLGVVPPTQLGLARRRENMVGVNMVGVDNVVHHAICECFEGIMLETCLLQPCSHVAGPDAVQDCHVWNSEKPSFEFVEVKFRVAAGAAARPRSERLRSESLPARERELEHGVRPPVFYGNLREKTVSTNTYGNSNCCSYGYLRRSPGVYGRM